MSENTKIQWTDHTFNPWIGCAKVSPGCANCYAEKQDNHRKWTPDGWGKGKPRKRTSDANWRNPLKWNNLSGRFYECNCGHREYREWDDTLPPGGLSCCRRKECNNLPETEASRARARVFCASLADWLDDEIPLGWLAELLNLIRLTPDLDWLLLTKRPENWNHRMQQVGWSLDDKPDSDTECNKLRDWLAEWVISKRPPHNVWMGTSAEDQERADDRVQSLLEIPAKVRFLSVEPLLGPITLSAYMGKCVGLGDEIETYNFGIDWVIIGGESGPKSRPCELNWISDLVAECRDGGAACFVKQIGANWIGDRVFPTMRVTDAKGGDIAEWPEEFRVREFPAQND